MLKVIGIKKINLCFHILIYIYFNLEPSYLKYYMKMRRKVVNPGKLRLSPNEEAFILKEDYERRRKLRLLQVFEILCLPQIINIFYSRVF